MISVIVPAHNEAQVIERGLKAMTTGAAPGELEVVVVCNGCTDDTADRARSCGPTVRVVELPVGNKIEALNAGDRAASAFPRLYVDADVILPLAAIRALARRLEEGPALAVAPRPRVDLEGCSWAVRAFYDINERLPSSREGIGGSGVYGLSEAGRARFDVFPPVTADDGFVRLQFAPQERETLDEVFSTVFAPSTLKGLVTIKTRSHLGSYELRAKFPALWANAGRHNSRALLGLFRDPALWPKLVVYCYVKLEARRRAKLQLRNNDRVWERDATSRVRATA